MVSQITSFSRNGVSDWLVQRVTAIILAVYTVVVVAILLFEPQLGYAQWRALFSATWMQIFTLITLLSTCAHAWIGMWTAGTDYLRPHALGPGANGLRLVYQVSCSMILLVYMIWGIKILWGN